MERTELFKPCYAILAALVIILPTTFPTASLAEPAPPFIKLNFDYNTIDFTNWNEPQNRHWSNWNLDKIMPFPVEIDKGSTPVHQFTENPIDLSEISVEYYDKEMNLAEYLTYSRTDGFLVLKNNAVIYEVYPRQIPQSLMLPENSRHSTWSSSKSFIPAVMGNIVESGAIDPKATLDEYIEDVGSGYTGVIIQDALDMNVSIKWSEDYSDPDSEGIIIFKAEAMHPGYQAWEGGARDFFRGLEKSSNPEDGITRYYTSNSSILGWLLAEVTGVSWNRLVEKTIWQKIGAEQNALNFEDQTGYGLSSGTFAVTLRDFARFAQIFAGKGTAANGQKIFSQTWFDTIINNPNATDYQPGLYNSNWKYTHQTIINNKGAMAHLGYCGQIWYANYKTGVVIVKMSTLDIPAGADKDSAAAMVNICEKIDDYLSN